MRPRQSWCPKLHTARGVRVPHKRAEVLAAGINTEHAWRAGWRARASSRLRGGDPAGACDVKCCASGHEGLLGGLLDGILPHDASADAQLTFTLLLMLNCQTIAGVPAAPPNHLRFRVLERRRWVGKGREGSRDCSSARSLASISGSVRVRASYYVWFRGFEMTARQLMWIVIERRS